MRKRNFASFAPFGVGIVVVLMLLAAEVVNHRNEYACALGVTAACGVATAPVGVAPRPLPAGAEGADRVAGLIRSSDGEGEAATWRLSLYLLGASLLLLAASLAGAVVVSRSQNRWAAELRAADDGKTANTERIIRLVESVATVIGALEERTRELETGVAAFSGGSATHHQGLAAVAAVLEQVRKDQIAGGKLTGEMTERLDAAMAAATEEVATSRQTLIDELLPSIARRDERLIAIDANLTAVTDRLARLAADTQHNIQETAVLTEIVRALERSVSDLSSGLIGIGGSPRGLPPRPAAVATTPPPSPDVPAPRPPEAGTSSPGPSDTSGKAGEPGRSPTSDATAGPAPEPTSDDQPSGGPERSQTSPSDDNPTEGSPHGQPKGDG